MDEHLIIFSTEMVRAYMDKLKTQTRRVIKIQPEKETHSYQHTFHEMWKIGQSIYISGSTNKFEFHKAVKCPFGKIGDRLWVVATLIILFSWCSVIGVGGESVSGYILSGPGKILSKSFVPSSKTCLVSEGTPLVASMALIFISSAAIASNSMGSCAS